MANEPGKAPGKYYRKGLSLIEVMNLFPTDDAARAWFEEVRWGGEPGCPHCGSVNVQSGAKHPSMTHRCREKGCRRFFSVKTGTAMQSSKLGLRIWGIAIYLMSTELKGRASMKLRRDLGITQKAAWHLAHRLRQAWEDNNGLSLFDGPVEVDESYFGGKRANMSNAKRKELEGTGRGPVGKTAVIGAKDRETGRVAARVIESTDRETLQGFVDDYASPDAPLYTDDATAYKGSGREHETVRHSAAEYVRYLEGEAIHTNGVESFWSMLKRAHKGTFHRLSAKHLQRYVSEFAGRHNIRDLDTIRQMENVAAGLVGRRLLYRDLVADNGLSGAAT
jgi:transposase-like protein